MINPKRKKFTPEQEAQLGQMEDLHADARILELGSAAILKECPQDCEIRAAIRALQTCVTTKKAAWELRAAATAGDFGRPKVNHP